MRTIRITDKIRLVNEFTGRDTLDYVCKYNKDYKGLLQGDTEIQQKDISTGLLKQVQENRSLKAMQQNILLGWVIEDYMCSLLGAELNGADSDRQFGGTITTEPDLKLANGRLVEVKATYKNEIKRNGYFYLKEYSLHKIIKLGALLCIVDVINKKYLMINPENDKYQPVNKKFVFNKMWVHIPIDYDLMLGVD